MTSRIRYTSFPRTEPPPAYIDSVIAVFRSHEKRISTISRRKGLTSDEVLAALREDLVALGFDIEGSKRRADKILRPVFFGENGEPELQHEVDGYHGEWRCGLEVEAGRAWMGNAIYRDLVQALTMVQVDTLLLAVANAYKYKSGGRSVSSPDYDHACKVANALYGHTRVDMPYSLVVIGY